jgi:hypothetical protein
MSIIFTSNLRPHLFDNFSRHPILVRAKQYIFFCSEISTKTVLIKCRCDHVLVRFIRRSNFLWMMYLPKSAFIPSDVGIE